ncbi:N-acetylmuramoyl-L-alanine amidase, partial [Streptomyces sp. NPDC001231]
MRSQALTAELPTIENGTKATLKQERTEPFSMLGITWGDPSSRVEGTIEARTRAVGSGQWSDWLRLDGSGGQGEAAAERGGTEPAWVGPSDGVEVRVTAGGRTSDRLPAGLRLDMVDPGKGASGAPSSTGAMEPAAFQVDAPDDPSESPDPTEGQPADSPPAETPAVDDPTTDPAESETPAESTPPSQAPSSSAPASQPPSTTPSPSAGATAPAGPPSTAPRPTIVSRAGWGADESISP